MVQARSTLHEFMPYGAPDLLAGAAGTRSRALVAALALWSMAFLLAVLVIPRIPHVERVVPIPSFHPGDYVPKGPELAPPMRPQPPVAPVAPRVRVPDAIPVPVPDAKAPSVDDAPQTPVGVPGKVGGAGTTTPSDGVENAPPDDHPQPGVWIDHDTEPELIRAIVPEYPSIAREARVEGTVYVQALVGRDGAVAETIVRKGDPMLVEAAVQAARASRFRPATANGHAVAVWVMMPFRFVLH